MDKKQLITAALIGAATFAAIVWLLDPAKVAGELARADARFLALALVMQVLSVTALSRRWQVFAEAAGKRPAFFEAMAMVVSGIAASNLTPTARMGGEPLKAYFLKKHGCRGSSALAAVVIEKATEIIVFTALTGIAIIWSAFILNLTWQITAVLCVSFVFTGSMATALLYVTLRRKVKAKWITGLLDKYKWIGERFPAIAAFRERMDDSVENYYASATRIATPAMLWKGLVISTGFWSAELIRAYLIFLALGTQAQFTVIAAAYVIANIASTLPLIPGAVEGAMIVIYSGAALNTVTAGTVTLIDRLASFWLVILAGIPATWYLGTHRRK